MGTKTKIQWCDSTWSPVTGCTPVSAGCEHCYAKRLAGRFPQIHGQEFDEHLPDRDYVYDVPFSKIQFHPDRLDKPFHWRKQKRIFVCSMGDIFHREVKFEWIFNVMETIRKTPQHTYLILTKRPDLMKEWFCDYYLGELHKNLWLGVTAENQEMADKRIPILLQIPAAKRFVSCEPLLSPIDISKYLGYNNQIGEQYENGKREHTLRNCENGGMDNRRSGPDMEGKEKQFDKNRTQASVGIFAGSENGERESLLHGGTSFSVVTLSRQDTNGIDDKSQERNQGRQQARKSGIDELYRANKTCDLYFKETSPIAESIGRKKSHGQIDGDGSQRDTAENRCDIGGNENAARALDSGTCREIRGQLSNGMGCSDKKIMGLDLTIAGPETGPGKRPMSLDWARSLRDQCVAADVPFFYKPGRLDGNLYQQFPK